MFSQRWLDRFFFSSPWRFSSFTSTLAKPGTAQIAQKVICFFLKPNQQINGLTFINQNTVQITPIKSIVWIAKLCHFIFQRQFDQSSPCCQLSVVNITIALSWSLFQAQFTAKFTLSAFIQLSLLQDSSSLVDLGNIKQALKCSQLLCAQSHLFPSLLFLLR